MLFLKCLYNVEKLNESAEKSNKINILLKDSASGVGEKQLHNAREYIPNKHIVNVHAMRLKYTQKVWIAN